MAAADQQIALTRARQTTLAALVEIDEQTLMQLTELTLPEIQTIQQEVSQILPAGNLLAFILSGLVKLKGRQITPDRVRQDLSALLRGLDLLTKSVYGMFVAGPATVLYAYQKLLQLSGKDLNSAFPQGTWQFYLEFGLREDTARHTNETLGFQRAVPPRADESRMAAAWLCAILELLYSYDGLLAADWRERVLLRVLYKVAEESGLGEQPRFARLARDWDRLRPYHRPAPDSDYLSHRQRTFEKFFEECLLGLPAPQRAEVLRRYGERQTVELPAFQEQMTLLSALRPETHREEKDELVMRRLNVGFVFRGHTYLLPACARDAQGCPLCYPTASGSAPIPLYALPDGALCDDQQRPVTVARNSNVRYLSSGQLLGRLRPPAPETVLAWVRSVFASAPTTPAPTLDLLLSDLTRAEQVKLRPQLPKATQSELAALRQAPILLNWDLRPHEHPLSVIRRDHRGVGDHALTLFRTARSMVFDQSHIYFDGMWGMAIAEILTDGAIVAYRALNTCDPAPSAVAPQRLYLVGQERLGNVRPTPGEVGAESVRVEIEPISRLRKWLKQRGVNLTVNDLLLLYRFFHAAAYTPSARVEQAWAQWRVQVRRNGGDLTAVDAAQEAVERALRQSRELPPALLIPMDASNVAPRERLFPTTFRNPLTEIGGLYAAAQADYMRYRENQDPTVWQMFDQSRRTLLAYLKAFGELLDALKAVTMRGESFNTATIRLLAHLPPSMQHLLDGIPQHIGILNEIIKGNEVFSNVGRVAPGSTLNRFTSAKDDGRTKELVWGILCDDMDRMHISLRDFRPFVANLLMLGAEDVARMLAQDYLDAYVDGFNQFVADLSKLVAFKGPG